MTTPRAQQCAYAGTWRHDETGKRFEVFYVTGAVAALNRHKNKDPREAGWYWRIGKRVSLRRLTSSREAWRAARETLAIVYGKAAA